MRREKGKDMNGAMKKIVRFHQDILFVWYLLPLLTLSSFLPLPSQVGFGIGELSSGSMPGADIIMGHVQDGVGYATDRWSYARVLPVVDDCQVP